jgi:hypothetical protein
MLSPDEQRQVLVKAMVRAATQKSGDAGCEWLHVDFEAYLGPFYFEACSFDRTEAGLIFLGYQTPLGQ